jgi:hypothetical protein
MRSLWVALAIVMAATILKRQGARNGFSSDLNTKTTADNQVEQKRKWFVAMSKPACVVLHIMVHPTRKMAGVGRDAYRRVAAVRQDMKNNVAATMVPILLILLVSRCHVIRFVHHNTHLF